MCFTMFLKIPVCTRSCAEESLSRAPGADFGGQDGAPRWPKWSPNPARKRVGSGLKFQLGLEAVLEAVLRPEKGLGRSRGALAAAGRRNGRSFKRGGKGGGGESPVRSSAHFNHGATRESRVERQQQRAQWLTRQLLELGSAFIKLGQLFSSRPDLPPAGWVSGLT